MSGDQIEPARLAHLQAEHERLKKNPRIRILGEGPRPDAEPRTPEEGARALEAELNRRIEG